MNGHVHQNGVLITGDFLTRGERPATVYEAADRHAEFFTRLACAIIKNAVDDLRLWRAAKNKKNGRRKTDLAELLDFFQPGRGLDWLISGAELKLNANQIRRGLVAEGLLAPEPWRVKGGPV